VTALWAARRSRDRSWTLVASVAFALLVVLVLFGWLRETPDFWQPGSGAPPHLRHLVAVAFYPLLLWVVCSVGWLTTRLVAHPPATLARVRRRTLCVVALAMLTGATLMLTMANNVRNLFDGRPLHWHAWAHQPLE